MRKLILVGILPPPFNGQSIAFSILIDHLREEGLSFNVINISQSYSSHIKVVSLFLRVIEYVFILAKIFIHCMFSKNLVYLQTSQSKNGFRRDVWINRVAKLFNTKIIAHLHGGNFNGFYLSQSVRTQELIKKEVLKYDRIIVLSNSLKNMYNFQPLIHDRIVAIPNGIDKATFVSFEKKISPDDTVHILYLSNLIESKGYLIVLETLSFLKKANISFKASFCGYFDITDSFSYKSTDEASKDFFARIKEYELEKEVTYMGVVTGKEKSNLLASAHFFVLPTQYINEGQPVSIIEAMRAGCVVITTNYRAIPEMIRNGETGFLLDDISPQEISNIIGSCANNPLLFSTVSRNAILHYNSGFTDAIHGEKMLNLLKECAYS